ncbi:MAG TPA: GFA family protein [Gammaproteobacteria bacterium]
MSIQHYKGGCQCGAVAYEVDVDLDNTITCNCSRCQKLGFVLAFAPVESFDLKSGEESLTEYRFNKKQIRHLFCKICGVESFAMGKRPSDGADIAAINVNCLEGVDPRSLSSKHVDGRSF